MTEFIMAVCEQTTPKGSQKIGTKDSWIFGLGGAVCYHWLISGAEWTGTNPNLTRMSTSRGLHVTCSAIIDFDLRALALLD